MIKKSLILASALTAVCGLQAQETGKGYLTGSFETNDIYYIDDEKTGAEAPNGRFGSNNYLKMDYYRGKFSAGVQLEAYLPRQLGYPDELGLTSGSDKAKLTNYYVSWQDENFGITAGTFYDQFGSGLLFRSWEDRALGMNNAVMGARFTYNYRNIVGVKAIWGMPRFGMKFSETQVRGLDLNFAISELAGWNNTFFAVEGSVLNKVFKQDQMPSSLLDDEGGTNNTVGYSGRINFEHKGFNVRAEYVDAGKKYYNNPFISNEDPRNFLEKNGNAQLIEAGYNKGGLGINLTARRLEWMDSKILFNNGSTANLLNYVPAMCTQYTYLLTTLEPYNSQLGLLTTNSSFSGEMGGQIDVFYNFRRGSTLGGKRGLKVHANFSTYYTIAEEGSAKAGEMLYRDLSVDFEKQFTRKFKLNFLYSLQELNDDEGIGNKTILQNIFVADMLYKFTPNFSTRLELQYLTTHESDKDWVAGLLELNFAPKWSIYGSDMYNLGSTKVHYYNAGVSYAHSRTRVALSWGRNRAGYVCSGGVCRRIEAYTGANLQVTMTF